MADTKRSRSITVDEKERQIAKKVGTDLGRENHVTGEINFSGVVRDALDVLGRIHDGEEIEPEDVFHGKRS